MTNFTPYKARREIAVIGVEATRGTAATKKYAFRWLTKNARSIPDVLENESGIGSDVKINDSAIDTWHSEASLGGKVTEDGIGYLLNGVLNKVTTVDNEDGTYTHTFERNPDAAAARKTFSLWDVRPAGIRLFKSLTMDNLNLKVEVGDSGAWLECDTALKGWKHEAAADFVTPAFTTGEKEFTSRMVTVAIADDVDSLAAGKLKVRSIEHNFEETTTVDHYVGEINNDPEFDSAPAEVKGSMVLKYRSTDIEEDYAANTAHAMSITIQNGDSKIEIIGTKVHFREVTESDGRDDIKTLTVTYAFEADENNGLKDVVVKVTNTIASYTA